MSQERVGVKFKSKVGTDKQKHGGKGTAQLSGWNRKQVHELLNTPFINQQVKRKLGK